MWLRYLIAQRLLARSGRAPRRIGEFVDWAYEAGLLRLSGIATQFRHQELQQWLTPATATGSEREMALVDELNARGESLYPDLDGLAEWGVQRPMDID